MPNALIRLQIYLDTTGDSNPRLYQHFGFEEKGRQEVAPVGVPAFDVNGGLIAMVRPQAVVPKSRL
jgi:hypothetical protein